MSGSGRHILPSARYISNMIAIDELGDLNSSQFTNLHQVFGQFLDHDVSHTPNVKAKDGTKFKCCTASLNQNGGQHGDVNKGGPCFPIDIPHNDSFFQPRRCMNFVRSIQVQAERMKCKSTSREQLNKLTSFIDVSMVYGTSETQLGELRTFQNGLLIVSSNNLSPEDKDGDCVKRNGTDYCFLTGDKRANEHPALSALHVIFVRLHNQIAQQLIRVNSPNRLWDDERLFEESRKIVEAILQNIAYNEWLPSLLGDDVTRKYRLKSSLNNLHRFDDKIDPRIMNAFSTTAFRYGHSSIPNDWTYGENKVPLLAMFNSPYFIQDFKGKGLDMIVEGILKDSIQKSDEIFGNGVRNTLFKTFKVPGLDLAALNIQRGRDHGLGPYNLYREYCGLKPITQFDGSTEQIRKLSKAYRHPDDVDLFVGGMTEPHVAGGIVGPTFACIIGQQFHNLKFGDRYWFENLQPPTYYLPVNPAALTIGQIRAIRKISMARILCDTTGIKYVPRKAFLHPSARLQNRLVSCKDYYSLPALDINLWKLNMYG